MPNGKRLTTALRNARWNDEAIHDASTLASLIETAIQCDTDGHDVTALLIVKKEKPESVVNALDRVTI